jgi:hypothetical protein
LPTRASLEHRSGPGAGLFPRNPDEANRATDKAGRAKPTTSQPSGSDRSRYSFIQLNREELIGRNWTDRPGMPPFELQVEWAWKKYLMVIAGAIE